jgi:hypothetical protein
VFPWGLFTDSRPASETRVLSEWQEQHDQFPEVAMTMISTTVKGRRLELDDFQPDFILPVMHP